jgi:hypothetical protein
MRQTNLLKMLNNISACCRLFGLQMPFKGAVFGLLVGILPRLVVNLALLRR